MSTPNKVRRFQTAGDVTANAHQKVRSSESENAAKLHEKGSITFEETTIYILPERIQRKRYDIMKSCARRNGFLVLDKFSPTATHVILISDLDTNEQVQQTLQLKGAMWQGPILSTKWFFDCVRNSKILCTSDYELPCKFIGGEERKDDKHETEPFFNLEEFNSCIPRRRAPLDHPNKRFSEPLEFLHLYFSVVGEGIKDDSRALAFRKAAATMKCLPFPVQNIEQIRGIKDISKSKDGHSYKIIEDILAEGRSAEVEEKRKDEKFLSLQALRNIYGVGPATAKRWYKQFGIQGIPDVIKKYDDLCIKDDRIKYGLAFYDDLTTPITVEEARKFEKFVFSLAESLLPGVTVQVMGGIRRGKDTGHDLDLLISHPEEGKERGLLHQIYNSLAECGCILHGRIENSARSNDGAETFTPKEGQTVDHFERCLGIFKLPKGDMGEKEENLKGVDFKTLCDVAHSPRSWKAIRVDLITSPASQYAYAALGWTGNKWYNRALRYYTNKTLGLILSSHGLWDPKQRKSFPAQTEREIFAHLQLEYREPWKRNF